MKTMGFVPVFRNELSLENRKLHHDDASVFCKSQVSKSVVIIVFLNLLFRRQLKFKKRNLGFLNKTNIICVYYTS